MLPYNQPERVSSDQGGSVKYRIPYKQEGLIASKIATAYSFIPCNLSEITQVFLTPVKLGTTSANGVALFTTTGGWQLDSLTLSVLADIDAWAQNVAYEIGTVIKNPAADTAYVCVVAHTSTTGGTAAGDWAIDLALGYWQALPSGTKFAKVTHTSPGASKVMNANYQLHGYKD